MKVSYGFALPRSVSFLLIERFLTPTYMITEIPLNLDILDGSFQLSCNIPKLPTTYCLLPTVFLKFTINILIRQILTWISPIQIRINK